MQRLTAEVILEWEMGKEYLFALKGKQIQQLEFNHKKGIGILAQEILTYQASYMLIRDIIQLGLEGGKMDPITAKQMVDVYFIDRPLASPSDPQSPMNMAHAIMAAAWIGVPDIKAPATPGGENKVGKEPSFDAATVKSKFMEFGVDPRYVDDHSMYETLSMFAAMDNKEVLTDDAFDEMKRLVDERKQKMGIR